MDTHPTGGLDAIGRPSVQARATALGCLLERGHQRGDTNVSVVGDHEPGAHAVRQRRLELSRSIAVQEGVVGATLLQGPGSVCQRPRLVIGARHLQRPGAPVFNRALRIGSYPCDETVVSIEAVPGKPEKLR